MIIENDNEINAIRLAILNVLKKNNYNSNSKMGIMDRAFIDMPLGLNKFKFLFLNMLPSLEQNCKLPMKCELTINELDLVLGSNWSIYRKTNSTTQQRILGKISLNYRCKTITGLDEKLSR